MVGFSEETEDRERVEAWLAGDVGGRELGTSWGGLFVVSPFQDFAMSVSLILVTSFFSTLMPVLAIELTSLSRVSLATASSILLNPCLHLS